MRTLKKYSRSSYLYVRMFFRKMNFKVFTKLKVKYLFLLVLLLWVLNFFGVFIYIFEKDYYTQFSYPLDEDIKVYVEQLKNGGDSERAPINVYNYTFLSNCQEKCKDDTDFIDLRLVYIIKSAMTHFANRAAIRKSWGFERRFSDVPIRRVFLVGIDPSNVTLQNLIMKEQEQFGDIVQANFIDSYYNNTIKTMMGFNWARKFCPKSKFYFFSDDDMYVSTKNVLRFIRNPTRYPEYLEDPVVSLTRGQPQHKDLPNQQKSRRIQQVFDFELPDEVQLYAGHLMIVAPLRQHFSKWFVSLEEYPFNMWPPYITAGAYVLSHTALDELYYASLFTKHFRFDDIYLAIVAFKAGLEPLHCSEFKFENIKSEDPSQYHYVISSHGFSDPDELVRFWEIQREAGNA